MSFLVEHRLTLQATCPVDDTKDTYNCIVSTTRTISVEEIKREAEEIATSPIYQEDFTRLLAQRLDAEVVTYGIHSNVYTTCRCGG